MKRLILMAGGVLVLAACDSATAPMSLHEGGHGASAKVKAPKSPVVTTLPGQTMNSMSGCEGGETGLYVHSGSDSTWVPCPPQQ